MRVVEQRKTGSSMEGRFGIAFIVAILVIVSATAVLLNPFGEKVNCQKKYEQATSGEISAEKIPEDCKPLTEDVEKELLLRALRGS